MKSEVEEFLQVVSEVLAQFISVEPACSVSPQCECISAEDDTIQSYGVGWETCPLCFLCVGLDTVISSPGIKLVRIKLRGQIPAASTPCTDQYLQ